MIRSCRFLLLQLRIPRLFSFKMRKLPSSLPLLLGTTFTSFFFIQSVNLIEDNEIKKVKSELSTEINKLRGEFGQMTICPEIKYSFTDLGITLRVDNIR